MIPSYDDTQRRQYVLFNSGKSPAVNVSRVVPRGSVLGPLLFMLYINDLSSNISSDIRLYADERVIYLVIKAQHPVHVKALNRHACISPACLPAKGITSAAT